MATETKPQIELFNHTKQLAKEISRNYDIPKDKAAEIVTTVFDSMKDIALEEGILGIKNFGSFRVQHQPNMQYYDFKAKEVKKTSRNVLVFYPSANLKKLINLINVKEVTEKRMAKKIVEKQP